MIAGLPLGPLFGRHKNHEIPNFDKVNSQIYRGGQPTEDGLKQLAHMGVKTILDLQEGGSRARREEDLVNSLGMRYVNVPMRGMQVPSSDQIERVLATLENRAEGPVFVHCKRGADRTGMVIACYRIRHDGWGNKKALAEARDHGMSWYQLPLQYYVLRYEPGRGTSIDASAAEPAGVQQ